MLRKTTAGIISQLSELTSSLTNHQYSLPLEILHGSSIGKHMRHIIEFYHCLQKGYDSGTVNYDSREHNPALENDKMLAIEALAEIRNSMQQSAEKMLILHVNFSGDIALDSAVSTTYERELIYNIEHAVHHAAIIKIALKNVFPAVLIPENFGIAHSTVSYLNKKETSLEIG